MAYAGSLPEICSVMYRKAPLEKAAVALAELQIGSIHHGARLLQAGARDLGVNALSKMVKPFVETMTQLMERQTKIPRSSRPTRNWFLLETE